MQSTRDVRLSGTPASPGSAAGPVHLLQRSRGGRPPWPQSPSVLVAVGLSAGELFDIPHRNLLAIVTEAGSLGSVAGELARELGIPAVVAVEGALEGAEAAAGAVVDGGKGEVLFSGRPVTLRHHDPGRALRHPVLPVELAAMVRSSGATAEVAARGVRGIGHFKTCDLIARYGAAGEQQEQEYIEACRSMAPHPVRFAACPPDQGGVLQGQAKALVAAAVHSPNLSITISAPDRGSLADARALLTKLAHRHRQELATLGLLVATPADALSLPTLLDMVDYLDLDTEGLLRLAGGRGDATADLFSPGGLRLLEVAAADAARLGLQVLAHGPLTAIPEGAIFLTGIGVGTLSLPMADLVVLEDALDGVAVEQCRHAAHAALGAYDAEHARRCLREPLLARSHSRAV